MHSTSRTDFAVTKFMPPRARHPLVLREQLRMGQHGGWRRKLTLVCAPAGFGKTTLLAQYHEWLRAEQTHPCWLTLEARDRDPTRLLLGLIRSLQTVDEEMARTVLGLLEIRAGGDVDMLVDILVNDIAASKRDIVLFLDDYHEVDGPAASPLVMRLLAYAPANLQVCLASRHVPSLNLSALRLRGETFEVNAADLRFTTAQTREFMCHLRGHSLSDTELQALHEQTEGWIAALQLTSLSLDKPAASQTPVLAGSHPEISDYLTVDLFARLPENLRDFLLASSVLDQMSPALCDHVLEAENSADRLEEIERANLFLIALDEHREWYRYHNLFRSFLRNQVGRHHSQRLAYLCRRASDWFSARGISEEAIEYARRSGDLAHMAELVETFAEDHIRHGRITRLISLIRELPRQIIDYRPWLSLYLAYAFFHLRRSPDIEAALVQAEAALHRGSENGQPYDLRQQQDFQAKAEAIRIGMEGTAGSGPALTARAVNLLESHPDLEPTYRCTILNLLGHLQICDGDYENAAVTLQRARALNARHDFIYGIVYADCFLGMCEAAQGRLSNAIAYYTRAEDMAASRSGVHSLGHDFARLLRGVALFEQNRLDEARPLIEISAPIAEDFGPIDVYVLARVALARMEVLDGNFDSALSLLDETAAPLQPKAHATARLALAERRIRLLLDRGMPHEAGRIADELGAMDPSLDFLPDVDAPLGVFIKTVIRCRVLIDSGQAAQVIPVLKRLQKRAVESRQRQRAVELIVLEIKAHMICRDHKQAQQRLLDAFHMVFPENYSQIFIGEIPELSQLLKDMLRQTPENRNLVPAGLRLSLNDGFPLNNGQSGTVVVKPTADNYFLVEPLSEREREVLTHIAVGKSNQEIASDMNVALNTVKWHVQNIFSKLGVTNRTAATLAAQHLRLIR